MIFINYQHDENLRTHPIWCTDNSILISQRMHQLSGDTKICQFDVTTSIHQNISSLNISMNFFVAVQILQTLKSVHEDGGDECFFLRTTTFDEIYYWSSSTIFHDEPQLSCAVIWTIVFDDVVGPTFTEYLNLLLERIDFSCSRYNLNGYLMTTFLMDGLVDASLRTLTQQIQQLEHILGILMGRNQITELRRVHVKQFWIYIKSVNLTDLMTELKHI